MPLQNSSFESLTGWVPYRKFGDMPTANIEKKVDGARAPYDDTCLRLQVNGWLHCGVYQQVAINKLATLRLEAYGLGFASQTTESWDRNDIRTVYTKYRVGLDANGGTDPASASIVWSELGLDYLWKKAEVMVRGKVDTVTVYLEGQIGDYAGAAGVNGWPMQYAKVFFDAVTLDVVEDDEPPAPQPESDWLEYKLTGRLEREGEAYEVAIPILLRKIGG